MRNRLQGLKQAYWLIPGLCVVGAVVLEVVAVLIDENIAASGGRFTFGGGPESARSLLSTISTSMLSLTALVFSITIVVLQLASTQFSPRALPTFLQDRQNQLTLGIFLATYVYSLFALREIRNQDSDGGEFVPALTVGIAFALVILSIAFFVAYIHHIATSIQVGAVLARIEKRTLARIEDYPLEDEAEPAPPPAKKPLHEIVSDRSGTFAGTDLDRLVSMAQQQDVVVRLQARPGDFLAKGMPALTLEGPADDDDAKWLSALHLVAQRDDHDDVTLGLRQILDMAGRALSPGINDPSTAVQCLNRLHDLLRRLGGRSYPREVYSDEDGRVRVVAPDVTWNDHVAMVVDEMQHWGRDSLQIRSHLPTVVEDLLSAVPPDRRRPLQERLPLFT